MTNDLIGQTVGKYKISAALGEGGMAQVYKAYQANLDRVVAIKILPPEHQSSDKQFQARFKREARAIARLFHPHIVPVYDFGRENKLTYIVMQYVKGGTLSKLIKQPLQFKHVAVLLGQVAEALDYAHEQGIIHRDIKPSNILVEREQRALLSDFGLAKILDSNDKLTASGISLGTPYYMSPEQGQGEKVDARTDVYALGVLLYEMLVGQLPFHAESPIGIIAKHIFATPPAPRSLNPDLPQTIDQLILKAMSKEREERYESAGALSTAFNQAVADMPRDLLTPKRRAKLSQNPDGPKCQHCHHINQLGNRFCEQCGVSLNQEPCSRCNYTNRPGVKFCEQCAHKLT